MLQRLSGDQAVQESLSRLVGEKGLAIVVAAGASADSGLPTWPELVGRLAQEAATVSGAESDDLPDLTDLLGATESAKAILNEAGRDFDARLAEILKPVGVKPGKLHRALASLGAAMHAAAVRDGAGKGAQTVSRLYTTNFDTLIERALFEQRWETIPGFAGLDKPAVATEWMAESGKIEIAPASESASQDSTGGAVNVRHLHGVALTDGTSGVVFSEAEFLDRLASAPDRTSIDQELGTSGLLIVGASLRDLLLAQYLKALGPNTRRVASREIEIPRIALVARQHLLSQAATRSGLGNELRRNQLRDEDRERLDRLVALDEAFLRARWKRYNLDVVFVDHYTEVAEFVEILASSFRERILNPGRAEQEGLPGGLQDAVDKSVGRAWQLFTCGADQSSGMVDAARLAESLSKYQSKQQEWSGLLRQKLKDAFVQENAGSAERFELFVWLVTPDGKYVAHIVSSDRVMNHPRVGPRYRIDLYSRRVAVRAVLRGKPLVDPRQGMDLRWLGVAAAPLTVPAESSAGDMPVLIGAVSLVTRDKDLAASLGDTADDLEQSSVLGKALRRVAQSIEDALADQIRKVSDAV